MTALLPPLDADGHLQNPELWTPAIAELLAQTHGLTLISEHLSILEHVRIFYVKFGHIPASRPLIRFLQTQNAAWTNAYLMQLFQTGLVARTLSKLAGLPKPANCL